MRASFRSHPAASSSSATFANARRPPSSSIVHFAVFVA
jgi:hypothetical protein